MEQLYDPPGQLEDHLQHSPGTESGATTVLHLQGNWKSTYKIHPGQLVEQL